MSGGGWARAETRQQPETEQVEADLADALQEHHGEPELGWKPETRFHDGLRETVEWYREHKAWAGRGAKR